MIISMNGVISIVYLLKLLPKVFEINRCWFFVIIRVSLWRDVTTVGDSSNIIKGKRRRRDIKYKIQC